MSNEPAPSRQKQESSQARYDQYQDPNAPQRSPRERSSRSNNVIIAILALILVALVAVGILVIGAVALFLRTPGSFKEPSGSNQQTTPTATATETPTATVTAAPIATRTPQETEEDRVHAAQEALRRAKQAKVDAQRRECDQFQRDPDSFLQESETRYYDRGIVRSYRQLAGVRVLNRSKSCVAYDIRGTVEWFDANGSSLGTTNFSLDRPISAGYSEAFSMTDGSLTGGTIAGAATSGNVKFTSASVGYMCLPPDNDCPKDMFCGQLGYCVSSVK